MAAMDVNGAESKSLFAQVQFYIVRTEDLCGDSAREVRPNTRIQSHGLILTFFFSLPNYWMTMGQKK